MCRRRPYEFNPLVCIGLTVSAAVLLVTGVWIAIQTGVNQPGGAAGGDESDAVVNTVAPRKSGEEALASKHITGSTKTDNIFASPVKGVSGIPASEKTHTQPASKSFSRDSTMPYHMSNTINITNGTVTAEAGTRPQELGPSSATESPAGPQTAASITAEKGKAATTFYVTSTKRTKATKASSPNDHGNGDAQVKVVKGSSATPSKSSVFSTAANDAKEGSSAIYAKTASRSETTKNTWVNLTSSTPPTIERKSLKSDEGTSWSITSSIYGTPGTDATRMSIDREEIMAAQSTKPADEMVTSTTSSTTVTSTESTVSEDRSSATATPKAMGPQALLCTYGAKTNASTLFPGDGLCDLIFFDSAYKNDKNFPTDSANFGIDMLHFLSVTPKYRKTAFGVGFAFEYRGTLTQDLTRTEPVMLEVFWKHEVFHFGILDVPVFGLKPYYMDDVFMCLKMRWQHYWCICLKINNYVRCDVSSEKLGMIFEHALDALSQRQRDLGRTAYVVLSAVPYNAGWVNYVAEKMINVYRPDLFVSQGHYTYGDNEAITCAVVPPTSLFRPSKLLGYAHDLNTAASALRQLETQGASTRWSISVGMKGRLAAPLPKFPLEIFSPCTQNPIAPAFDAYTEVCNNQDLWQKPAYDTKHHAMLSRNTKRNMMFVYDNEESLCRKLCLLKTNYTGLRFGLAAFDLDYEDYSNSCRRENKFSAFSRLQTLRKLVDYFKDHFDAPFDESSCVALVPS